ncbi:nitrile hydratase accessory protein [Aestuariivirga sp. YIM B02566]|uniref:Nitrile hydratase accessory protein n=1 Tax=Taklimakanibacter albus TaxID=2800327 RepID=A0ACC5RDA0_9HYPH|nr:nitrile hydratase accessory protein [Aestuariivirga sp. YIM B02566]MBK1870588.1 nitrile hydratase accessory protein [Aestuariivirga sp. YIM B02566]
MSQPDHHRLAIAALEQARPQHSQLFQAPWQARIFALIVEAVKEGHFPWTDFQARLVAALARNEDADGCETDEYIERHYFDAWLIAAEETLQALGLIAAGEVERQIETVRAEVDRIRSIQQPLEPFPF